jgi:predicted amidohydrolase
MEKLSKYGVACVQLSVPSVFHPEDTQKNLDKALRHIRYAVEGNANYGAPVKLVVLPECSLHGFAYEDSKEYIERGIYVTDESPEIAAFVELAKELDIIIVAGSIFEVDPKYPAHVFNTVWMLGAEGIIMKYRKVTPWVPLEPGSSPAQIIGYEEELFPVADTPLGKLGMLNCYDFVFPENARQITHNGAEVIIRVSAYMAPFVNNPQTDLWRVTSQARSMENVCYSLHCNQGSNLEEMAPHNYPGNSMVVDFEGRVIAETPNTGDEIVYARIDLDAQRAWRAATKQHLGLGHVRTQAYTYLDEPIYPCNTHRPDQPLTVEETFGYTADARALLGYDEFDPRTGQPVTPAASAAVPVAAATADPTVHTTLVATPAAS